MKKILIRTGPVAMLVFLFSIFFLCNNNVFAASAVNGERYIHKTTAETTTETPAETTTEKPGVVKPDDPPVIDFPDETTEEPTETTEDNTEETSTEETTDTTEETTETTEETTDTTEETIETSEETAETTEDMTGSGKKQTASDAATKSDADKDRGSGVSLNLMVIGICAAVIIVILIVVIIVLLVSRKKKEVQAPPKTQTPDVPPVSAPIPPISRDVPPLSPAVPPVSPGVPPVAFPVKVEIFNGNSLKGSGVINMTDELIIGSSPDCDIVFAENYVALKNTRVFLSGNTVYIENLDPNSSTFVAGLIVDSPAPLRSGDVISIGEAEFCLIF